MKALIFLGLIVGFTGCSLTSQSINQVKKGGDEKVHINEIKCRDFMMVKPRPGEMVFTGQSKFRLDINEAKSLAYGNAQSAMARSIKSKVASSCLENTRYSSSVKKTTKSVNQSCQTSVKVEEIDVSQLSKNSEYCLEIKKFQTAGVRKEIYRQTAKIIVSENEFDRFVEANLSK